MKKTLCAMLLLFMSTGAFSQIYKGQWMVGGDATFDAKKVQNFPTITELSLSPSAGYFLMDKLAAGLQTTVISTNYGGGRGSETGLFGSVFARYYLLPAAQKVNILTQASFGLGHTSSSSGTGTPSVSKTSNFFRVAVGPAIFLNPHVALEITPFYRKSGETSLTDKNDIFGLSV